MTPDAARPFKITLGALVAGTLLLSTAWADESPDTLVLGGQSVTPSRVADAPMPGWKEVTLPAGGVFYTNPEHHYVIVGTLFENTDDRLINLTEVGQREGRVEALQDLPDEAFVSFPATGEEIGVITVFTDTSCPYCGMLHGDIEEITAAGITVHYLPFPRMGINHPVAQEFAEIWCSEDPQFELSTAFDPGRPVLGNEGAWEDCGPLVVQSYELGQTFGIQGTPAIVLSSGEVGEGYVPVEQLVRAVSLSE